MKRQTMFLDWKNQYCQNDYTIQGNLQIQWNPIKLPMVYFIELEHNFKMCMETQKTPNSQHNSEKEKWNWRNQAPWLQTILQSYSNQNSMALAQIQKYRLVDQDRKPRNKPTCLWSNNLWQRRQEYNGNAAEKIGQLPVKEWN